MSLNSCGEYKVLKLVASKILQVACIYYSLKTLLQKLVLTMSLAPLLRHVPLYHHPNYWKVVSYFLASNPEITCYYNNSY